LAEKSSEARSAGLMEQSEGECREGKGTLNSRPLCEKDGAKRKDESG